MVFNSGRILVNIVELLQSIPMYRSELIEMDPNWPMHHQYKQLCVAIWVLQYCSCTCIQLPALAGIHIWISAIIYFFMAVKVIFARK